MALQTPVVLISGAFSTLPPGDTIGPSTDPVALASGNAALVLASTALASGNAGISTGLTALASGNAGLVSASNKVPISGGYMTGQLFAASGVVVSGTLSRNGFNVVTVGDVETVTSTMIASGTIIDADVNISGAINATKLRFLQAGASGVARTVDSKLKDTVSVKDFGAVGDGVTDDTAPVYAAKTNYSLASITLAGATYNVLSLPAGWNFFNGSIVLPTGITDDQPNNESYGVGALSSNTFIPRQFASSTLNFAAGNYNTAFGNYALGNNTTGRRQTAVGANALRLNTAGFYNTAIGANSLFDNVLGNYNVAVGTQALQSNTGSSNTGVGNGALVSQTNGVNNVAIGDSALGLSTAVNRTIAIGVQACYRHTGNDSIGIGDQALSAPSSTGLYNIAIGSASLGSATSANSNVAVGRRAGLGLTTGTGNTMIGNDAMVGPGTPTTGANNTAVGNNPLPNLTTGYQNVGVGANAGTVMTTGFNNVCVGRFAGQAITTGAGNVAIGEQALSVLSSGNYNTAVGVGTNAASNYGNTTMLGYNATVTGSNQVQLGDLFTTTYVYGTVQNRSDQRDKTDIRDTLLGLDFINALRPVDFKWDLRDSYRSAFPEPLNPDATEEEKENYAQAVNDWVEQNKLANLAGDQSKKRKRYHHGLIAQEVKATCDSINVDFGGYQDHKINGGDDVLSVGYSELIAPLIKSVQQLSDKIEKLEKRL